MTSRHTDRMGAANRAIREAEVAARLASLRRAEARRGVVAIDEVLEAVEEHHLADRPRQTRLLPSWRDHLECEGGLEVPQHILALENTVHLHEALLDWQDELLDQVAPGRMRPFAVEMTWGRAERVA